MRRAAGDPALLGQALTQAGASSISYREVAEAELYVGEALSVLRRSGRTKRLATALLVAGGTRLGGGDLRTARAFVEEALALFNALGDVRLRDACEARLATIAFDAGQVAEAIDRARRAVEASHRHGTLMAEFLALHWLAGFLILDNQIGPGRAAALRAFELSRAFGNAGLPRPIYPLALVLADHGEIETAARLVGFADSYADQHQIRHSTITTAVRGRLVERLHSAMGCEACQSAMVAGAAWSEQEAVAAATTA
jgi:hypothetical protein